MSSDAEDATTGIPAEHATLRHALEALAARASRTLSSRAQSRLELSLLGIERTSVSALSARLGPLDRAVTLVRGGDEAAAFVWLSRELAFALLALRFGSRKEALDAAVPERGYTRIEERALERTAIELWREVGASGTAWTRHTVRVAGVEDARRLCERPDHALWLGSFSVTGLATTARVFLRLAMPPPGDSCEAQPFGSGGKHAIGSGGKNAIEAKHGMDAEGASASSESPDFAACNAAPAELSQTPQAAASAVWIVRGTTVALDGDRAGRPVLRLDGRVVAEGTLLGSTPHPVLRVERILELASKADGDAG